MATVSLCMIVKNEERCIERCLKSVENKVDQIIIVDTGSTDSTIDICKKYTDHIYSFEWLNDFAAARNHALQFAQMDYILQLDADEYIEEWDTKLIQELNKDAYFITIRNDMGSGTVVSHKFVRLFRNDSELKYKGALHEQIDLITNKITCGTLPITIYHDGYQQQIIQSKDKLNRNLTIIQKELKDNPSAFNYMNYGTQLIYEQQYEEALSAFKQAYAIGKNYSFTNKIVINIMKCLVELKRYEECLAIGRDVLLLHPHYSDVCYLMGLTYMDMGYFKDAETHFLKCLQIGDSQKEKEFDYYEGTGSYLAMIKLCEIAILESKTEAAQHYLTQALHLAPDMMVLLKLFLELHQHATRKELFSAITSIWTLSEKRLLHLIQALYQLRHPVLVDFLQAFRINIPEEIQLFCHFVQDDIAAAQLAIDKFNNDLQLSPYDVVYLSVLTKDDAILSRYRNLLQMNSQEYKWLRAVVKREEPRKYIVSAQCDQIWKQLITDIMHLRRYDIVEQMIPYSNHAHARNITARCLLDFNFNEIVLDILRESDNRQERYDTYMIAASALTKMNQTGDAIYYYEQAVQITDTFEAMYHLYRLYQSVGDDVKAQNIRERMQCLNPRSPWAHGEI